MKTLGSILICEEQDVVLFRNKIFEIVSLLCEDTILATKIASSISSFCKFYIQIEEVRIVVSLEVETSNFDAIKLDFGKISKEFDLENISQKFFNEIGKVRIDEDKTEVKFKCKINSNSFDKAKKVFNTKSVEELLNDIKSKNIELESSFSKLKVAKDLNARMESELEVGKNIQMSMLPNNEFSNQSIEIYAYLAPAKEVGGDFYDFFFVDDNHIGLVVGDVSGKGVPAALMMAVCKTLLKSHSNGSYSTAEIMTIVNNEMARENNNYMFVTIFMAILNIKTGELKYTNAGHNPTYIKRTNGSIEKLSDLHGPVVAAVEDLKYKESTKTLNKGEFLFLYTDGIPEAHNNNEEMYTDESLEQFLLNDNFSSPKSTVQNIINLVEEFENGAERFDDITALCANFIGIDR